CGGPGAARASYRAGGRHGPDGQPLVAPGRARRGLPHRGTTGRRDGARAARPRARTRADGTRQRGVGAPLTRGSRGPDRSVVLRAGGGVVSRGDGSRGRTRDAPARCHVRARDGRALPATRHGRASTRSTDRGARAPAGDGDAALARASRGGVSGVSLSSRLPLSAVLCDREAYEFGAFVSAEPLQLEIEAFGGLAVEAVDRPSADHAFSCPSLRWPPPASL